MTTYTDVFGSDAVPSTLTGYVEVTLSANTQFYWPEVNSETNLVADIMDVTASGVFNMIMPPANQVSAGRNILINNVGSQSFYVVDADGTTLALLNAGQIKCLYLIDNSAVAGVWRAFTFGTGTSSADASLLNGAGLTVLGGKLAQMAENRTVGTSATLVSSDRASSYVFSSSGAVTCNMLQGSVAGDGYFIMLSNQGSGSVTLDPYSTETIDGEADKALAPGESCIAVCDGNNWVTIGHGRSTEFQFTKLVLDVTTGSPFTLSSVQAQNKLIQFIGNPLADVILNIPKVVSVYYIQGAFSGSNYVQVQTTTGDYVRVFGTDRVIVYCDGEDVVLAQTTAIPATDLAGGVAGALVCQVGIGDTDFTLAGVSGQVLRSTGTGKPVWDDLIASDVLNTPSGNIVATTVQAAIQELDSEKASIASPSFTGTVTAPRNFNASGAYGALQVGATDVMRFGSDNSGQLAGFRNRIINGAMQIWQRGASITIPNGSYAFAADRWKVVALNGTGVADNGGGSLTMYGGTGVTGLAALHIIEAANCADLAGKNATLSATFRTGNPNITQVTMKVYRNTVLDNTSGSVLVASFTHNVQQGVWGRFSDVVAVPASATYGLLVEFSVTGATSVAQNFQIDNVQLEEGSIATPFEQRPIGLELSLCQRYYQFKEGLALSSNATVASAVRVNLGTKMRVTPTVVTSPISGTGAVFSASAPDTLSQAGIHSMDTGASCALSAEL